MNANCAGLKFLGTEGDLSKVGLVDNVPAMYTSGASLGVWLGSAILDDGVPLLPECLSTGSNRKGLEGSFP